MPAPWVAGARARIVGRIHGQQTINVMHFGTNDQIADESELDTILLQLAQAMLECVTTVLLPAVTADWTCIQCDAQRIFPVMSDPVIATNPQPFEGGNLSPSSTSFAATLVNIRTGGGGRRGRGRIFLPPAGETEIENSLIDGPTLTLIAAYLACVAAKFMGVNPSTPWHLGVLSQKRLSETGGTFDNAFRPATNLNPVAAVSLMSSRKVGSGS